MKGQQLPFEPQSCCSAGVTINAYAVDLLKQLLETNFRLHIFREYADWIHPLYEAHVKPTLTSHYKSIRGTVSYSSRHVMTS